MLKPRTILRNSRVVTAVTGAICLIAVSAVVSHRASHPSESARPNGSAAVAADYRPKDVDWRPKGTPLPTPSEAPLKTDVVSIDLTAGSELGPNTSVSGHTSSRDRVVYYRVSDYRSGQVAAGESEASEAGEFQFKPEFTREYLKGDPATLDVFVLNPDGTEQTTRVTVKLK